MEYGIQLATSSHHWKVVKRAEELGFTHAWFYDTQLLNADVFVAMAAAAMNTTRIKLCTGVLIPSNRIAPVAASALASLNALAPGRIVCGVSTGFTARRTVGLPAITLKRLEEYIRVVRALLDRETVEWSEEGGSHKIRFLNPELGLINLDDPIPFHLSAFGPKSRALAAKLGTGWMSGGNPKRAAAVLGLMRQSWQEAGRDANQLYSTTFGNGCVLAEGEPADSPRARAQAGPSATMIFHDLAEEEELGTLGFQLPPQFAAQFAAYREIYRNYQPPDARYLSNHRGHLMFLRPEEQALVSPELIRAFTFTGTPAELVEGVRGIKAAGYSQFAVTLRVGHEMAMLDDWSAVLAKVSSPANIYRAMLASAPVTRDLVLVGGGHSHVAVLRRFGMKPMPGVRLTLICRELHTPYSGMLPGLVAGHYGFDDAHIDLGPLARFAGARLIHDEAIAIDRDQRRVRCHRHPPIAYDVLSLDVGAAPRLPDGAACVVPVKPIGLFLDHWQALVARVRAAHAPRRIAVIGAGAGGVELILAAAHRLRREVTQVGGAPNTLDFVLVSDGDTILPTHAPAVRARLGRILRARGIDILTGHRVIRVEPGVLHCANGARVAADEMLYVTAAAPSPLLAETGLALDGGGFIAVRDTLQSVTDPAIFAAGDAAHMVAAPREKAGVYAVRQGPVLARNLRRALGGGSLAPYVAQRRHLALIGTGDDYAVASRGAWSAEGRWVWRWKQAIDRRFMDKYNHLPAMAPAPGADAAALGSEAATAMRCGGCGAKIGSDVLKRALGRIAAPQGDGVVIGLAAPDDAAVIAVPPGKLLVQSVDFFRAFVEDPFVFGRIAANHALGDIYAMGGEPHTALAIATLPVGPDDKLAELLFQLLSGAVEVLTEAGATLVGGHTGEGAELALGFAVNGFADQGRLLRKGGMRPGDRLVLTKPLGTGTLFAADMRLKAKGRWIAAALEAMAQSNRDGAACLVRHGATAATDVTGFGLAGHLLEMVEASGVAVELDLAALPVLDGAADTIHAGIVSSLQPENLRFRRALGGGPSAEQHPLYPLLFDPQTAGGLLASVPPGRAQSLVEALRLAGYARAAEIGRVVAPGAGVPPLTVLAEESGGRTHQGPSNGPLRI